jgi:Uri superfamily endonuclease
MRTFKTHVYTPPHWEVSEQIIMILYLIQRQLINGKHKHIRQHLTYMFKQAPVTAVVTMARAGDEAAPGASDTVHGLGSSECD